MSWWPLQSRVQRPVNENFLDYILSPGFRCKRICLIVTGSHTGLVICLHNTDIQRVICAASCKIRN